ncbi:MAG: endonuclease III [Bacteroidetes bacterium]|nr:endonuclease III [Bacteroidota bacterium]MCW5897336.1 endonuclease III [Bacteroidota bacterium]
MTRTRHLRTKTLRVATTLEKLLGIPRQTSDLPPPLDMLIATILSQNTNDKNSHRAYTTLRAKFPRWDDVADAPMRSVIAAIRSGGMANQKSARIKQTLRAVKTRYGRHDLSALKRKPSASVLEELTSLNGVGLKTASCVLLFSMERDVFPVDTHVHRICNRLGLANSNTPEKTFEQMKTLIPKGKGYSFHTNLIRFGRMMCRSARPSCGECPLFDECLYEGKKKRKKQTRVPSTADHDFMLLDNVR